MKDEMTPFQKVTLTEAIREAYKSGQEDEALEPIVKVDGSGRPRGRIGDGDSVIFYDIRGEREVELTRSLIDLDFPYFRREKNLRLHFVTMIRYDPSLQVRVAFPAEEKLDRTLVEVVCRARLRLAKVAESEKAVHIGYFLNGKRDDVFPGEQRFIVPSPQGVSSYDKTPEMSAPAVAREVMARIQDPAFSMIIANLANVDVVGHIEDRRAVLRAVEETDKALGAIASECRRLRVPLIVTSDHGSVEEWLYPDGTANTGHTKNPVPFILADFRKDRKMPVLEPAGELADVAPTVLDLLGLSRPREMTGHSLVIRPHPLSPASRVVLLILDGWGHRDETFGNLIREASTPHFDALWAAFPHALLQAAGEAVGMPAHAVGNSEAGHLHLGAGRRVLLDRVKIDRAVEDGRYFQNPAFLWAFRKALDGKKPLHLMGIVSHYSSHGTLRHLFALMRLAKEQGLEEVYIHGFIGRRGEKPESGALYAEKVEEMGREIGAGELVTVMGRHWSLDREHNWDRIEKAYRALVEGAGTRISG
ncbi:MAG: sulfatase-like hydrolase/transferase [Candidatus Aminicenantes bacterium]|nr:sulfatase-like hydrolase/transferase [Candidatus Aminicenantes bacterium]